MTWRPGNPLLAFDSTRLLDVQTKTWKECPFTELKNGDIFQVFVDFTPVDPATSEPDTGFDIVSRCVGDVIKNPNGVGYAVMVERGELDQMIKDISH